MDIVLRHDDDVHVPVEGQQRDGPADNNTLPNRPSLNRDSAVVPKKSAAAQGANEMFFKGDYDTNLVDIIDYSGDIAKTLDDVGDQKKNPASSNSTNSANDNGNTKNIMKNSDDEDVTETRVVTSKETKEIVLDTIAEEQFITNVDDVRSSEFTGTSITLTHPTDGEACDPLGEDDLLKSDEICTKIKDTASGHVNDNNVKSTETVSDATAGMHFENNVEEIPNESGAARSKTDEDELVSSDKERKQSARLFDLSLRTEPEIGNDHSVTYEHNEENIASESEVAHDEVAATTRTQTENREYLREDGRTRDEANDKDLDESTEAADLTASVVVRPTQVVEKTGESFVELFEMGEDAAHGNSKLDQHDTTERHSSVSSSINEDLRDDNGEDIAEGGDDVDADVERRIIDESDDDRYELTEGYYYELNSESAETFNHVTGTDANDPNGTEKGMRMANKHEVGDSATATRENHHSGLPAKTTEGIKKKTATRSKNATKDDDMRVIETSTIAPTRPEKRTSKRKDPDKITAKHSGEHRRKASKRELSPPQAKQRQRDKKGSSGSEMLTRPGLEEHISKAPQIIEEVPKRNLLRRFLDTIVCTSETSDTSPDVDVIRRSGTSAKANKAVRTKNAASGRSARSDSQTKTKGRPTRQSDARRVKASEQDAREYPDKSRAAIHDSEACLTSLQSQNADSGGVARSRIKTVSRRTDTDNDVQSDKIRRRTTSTTKSEKHKVGRSDDRGIGNNDVHASSRKRRLNRDCEIDKMTTKRSDRVRSKTSTLGNRDTNVDKRSAKKKEEFAQFDRKGPSGTTDTVGKNVQIREEVSKKGMFQKFLDMIDSTFEVTSLDEMTNDEVHNDLAKPKRVHHRSKRGSVRREENSTNGINNTDTAKKSSARRSARADEAHRTFTTQAEIHADPDSRQFGSGNGDDTTKGRMPDVVSEDDSVQNDEPNSGLFDLTQSNESLIMDCLSALHVTRADLIKDDAGGNRPFDRFMTEDEETRCCEAENSSTTNEIEDRSLLDTTSIDKTRTLAEDRPAVYGVDEDDEDDHVLSENESSVTYNQVIQSELSNAESSDDCRADGLPEFHASEVKGFLCQQNQMGALTSSCEAWKKRAMRSFVNDYFVFEDVSLPEDDVQDEMANWHTLEEQDMKKGKNEGAFSCRVSCQVNSSKHLPSGEAADVYGVGSDSVTEDDFSESCAFQIDDAVGKDDVMERAITKDGLLVNPIALEASSLTESYDGKQKADIKTDNTNEDSAVEEFDVDDYISIDKVDKGYIEQHETDRETATKTDLAQNILTLNVSSRTDEDIPCHAHSELDCIAAGDSVGNWASRYEMGKTLKKHTVDDECISGGSVVNDTSASVQTHHSYRP